MRARQHPSHRPARWLGSIFVGFGLCLGSGALHAELLSPTPLILKDGRIASVSVHVLPFPSGQATIGSTSRQSLLSLTREMATDCFLTAQVIGHVGSEEVEANDTLASHRLARSRADAVQASLIDTGLPAKSIASVWDWQFMVLEPRATLWVFELTRGEDCEGRPLENVVAAVAAAQPAARQPAPSTLAAEETDGPGVRSRSRPTTGEARSSGATAGDAAPTPLTAPARAAATPVTAAPAAPLKPRPAAAPSGAGADRPASTAERATRPTRQVARATDDRPSAGSAEERSLSIVFANNSSYFPAGARKQLEALIGGLSSGGRYRVELIASVSDASSVVGAANSEEAARYNQWLANRRLDRVQSWLEVNAKDQDLIIQPAFVSQDDSRRVVIRIGPASTS